MVAAVEQGYPQAEIADAAYALQRAVDSGERVVVGVNAFAVDEDDDPPLTLHAIDPDTEANQLARLMDHRRSRDTGRCHDALATLRAVCDGTDNIMPALIRAAQAGATMGEMCDVFRDVWGSYRDPARW